MKRHHTAGKALGRAEIRRYQSAKGTGNQGQRRRKGPLERNVMRVHLRLGVEGVLSRHVMRPRQQIRSLRGKGKSNTRCLARQQAFWMSNPSHAVLLAEGKLQHRPKKNARGEVVRNASVGLAR